MVDTAVVGERCSYLEDRRSLLLLLNVTSSGAPPPSVYCNCQMGRVGAGSIEICDQKQTTISSSLSPLGADVQTLSLLCMSA
jgi:hypothetical protein